mmetsp:Transcript_6173/g.21926  ORF Transcript_6173/g.21926 Transcript_6173/m.21926 type:complete len:238 (-) Transcript_6173:371-1084(-)
MTDRRGLAAPTAPAAGLSLPPRRPLAPVTASSASAAAARWRWRPCCCGCRGGGRGDLERTAAVAARPRGARHAAQVARRHAQRHGVAVDGDDAHERAGAREQPRLALACAPHDVAHKGVLGEALRAADARPRAAHLAAGGEAEGDDGDAAAPRAARVDAARVQLAVQHVDRGVLRVQRVQPLRARGQLARECVQAPREHGAAVAEHQRAVHEAVTTAALLLLITVWLCLGLRRLGRL